MKQITIHRGEHGAYVYLNEPVDVQFVQEAGSSLKIHLLHLSSNDTTLTEPVHNSLTVIQQAPDCRTDIYGLAYLRDGEEVSTETHVIHAVGEGVSNQLIKFVLRDHAKGHFVGDLRIAPDAQKVEAHQTNRNLLLSDDAQMRTQPQLEIYADDVQATHGSSTGQLDESAIFYMRQRGLSEGQARQLLVNAFMQDILQTIDDEDTRAHCTRLTE